MQDTNSLRRIRLLGQLLIELKDTYRQLEETALDIERLSGSFYTKALEENLHEIRGETEKYTKNMDRIRDIHSEITSGTNAWYQFVKDGNECAKLTFPLKFHLKKLTLHKQVTKLNNEISRILIENRFIKEQLTILEHRLEVKAIQQIKLGSIYQVYEQMLMKKDSLVEDLKYLIPTFPGLCPADITLSGIDELSGAADKINNMDKS